jgi:hypothetical protein
MSVVGEIIKTRRYPARCCGISKNIILLYDMVWAKALGRGHDRMRDGMIVYFVD